MDFSSVSPTLRPFSLSPLVENQGALLLRLERPHVSLLIVEIDLEHDEVIELGLARQLHENRILRSAYRALGRKNIDKDRLALLLRLGKVCRPEGFPLLPLWPGARRAAQRQRRWRA
jgi:hypothetical protein